MNIQNWIKSAYVTIGNPPFFRLEGFPSVKRVSRLALISLAFILTHYQGIYNFPYLADFSAYAAKRSPMFSFFTISTFTTFPPFLLKIRGSPITGGIPK